MVFSLFFLIGSALMLVSVLFVLRRRDSALRGFGVAVSLTTVTLLAGAILRLTEPVAHTAWRQLSDGITVANLSACAILLVAWTVRLWRETS